MRRWVVPFAATHIGPDDAELAVMLERVGHESLDALTAAALPAAILDDEPLALPPAAEPAEVTQLLAAFAASNTIRRSLIGLGYAGTHTPPVIRRNVLESPAWYTAYTPYQPEISQGRLEALLTFQTVVADLTGMAVAGASMLDEPTAAAEAVALMRRASRAPAGAAVVVDAGVLPATLAVVRTRADAIGMPVVVADVAGSGAPGSATALPPGEVFGVLVQQPGASGALHDVAGVVATARERGALVTVAADLLAATLVRSPGEEGADVAVGSAQRFGVPMGGGGPHAGFLAVRSGLERQLPGRLVGVSVDADGAPAYRLALQTREQHIRRDRATSNICTAQVLLAVMAGMYAVVHGPHGLAEIATRTAGRAACLAARLAGCGWQVVHRDVVDTVQLRLARPGQGSAAHVADAAVAAAAAAGYWIRRVDAATIGLACDETTTAADVDALVAALGPLGGQDAPADGAVPEQRPAVGIPEHLARTSAYLTHPVFSAHRSETSVLRYLRRLADADYALDRGMIPLGSCTMKLNATVELEPVSWPAFADLHPFAPAADAAGTAALVADLEAMLAEVTGYAAVSVQPNAGSQGELAGLLAIRAFHDAAAAAAGEGASRRRVCLVPASAHGTNAASAVMAGLRVVAVATGGDGALDLADLAAKVSEHADDLAAIMVTYPSTHGVYEESITTVCDLVHAAGGQVYVDGANLNALVGLARPGRFGADVSHLNLHKTFCIPHGGGGPGVGPVAVAAHLAPFLPGRGVVGQVSGAPWGSAGILPVSWAYLRLMGPAGLRRATQVAVASANYVAARLSAHFPVLYTGANALVAHECVLDLRPMTKETGVSVEDVAKRLVDYGFHAPTVSFPVAGTLMVEPTESEDLAELDRFCDAMAAIAAEVDAVRAGRWSLAASPLRQAPHTAAMLVGDWDHPYTRAQAVYPAGQPGQPGMGGRVKYWPPVRRIDGAHGDRNLFCSCPPVAELAQVEV